MNKTSKAIYTRLYLCFLISVIVTTLLFILCVAYTSKYGINMPNITLERYGIIITLVGISGSIWMFSNVLNKADKTDFDSFLKKYQSQYFIRLAILLIVCSFNIMALYFTGAKNFYFMVIITIFAFSQCIPQKRHLIPDDEND